MWHSARKSHHGQQDWDWQQPDDLDHTLDLESGDGKVSYERPPLNCDQRRFFHKIGLHSTLDIVKVYDDMRVMLEQVYASDLASIFDGEIAWAYEWHRNWSKLDFEDSHRSLQRGAIHTAEIGFTGYLDYRMSLGLPYLSAMYRTKSPSIVPIDRFVDRARNWTDRLMTRAVVEHRCRGFHGNLSWPYSSNMKWPYSYKVQSRGAIKQQSPEEYRYTGLGWTVDE